MGSRRAAKVACLSRLGRSPGEILEDFTWEQADGSIVEGGEFDTQCGRAMRLLPSGIPVENANAFGVAWDHSPAQNGPSKVYGDLQLLTVDC